MSNTNDLASRMQKIAASFTDVRGSRRVAVDAVRVEASKSYDPDAGSDMKTNGVYQIMNKTNLSSDEQINAIAQYLAVEGDDYTSARRRFGEFQSYFNHVQSEGMQLDMKGLERLIEEVKSALKPEVEKIVQDVVAVQQGVDESKHLLEVMRTARLEGKSIDQIKEAIDLNDHIVAQIGAISDALTQMGALEETRKSELDAYLDEKLASEKGFWNGLKRGVGGPDKRIARAIDDAQTQLQEVQRHLQETQEKLHEKEAERNTNLESGPLTILRSIDATDDGFAANILATAKRSLDLIQGSSQSVQRLLKRMSYSKTQAMNISESLAKAEVREAILEGAIQRVAHESHDKSEVVKKRLIAMDEKLAGVSDAVEAAAMHAERVGVAELQKTALAYEEDAKRTHASFAMTAGNSVEAQSRASGFYNLLLAQEDMLQQVAARTLPETARALRMGLEVNVGMQTTELASSIQSVTRRAIEIGQQSYKDLATTQGELRAADLKLMEDAIQALTSAQDSVVEAAEATVKHSTDKGNLTGSLSQATAGLRDLLEQFDDIRARTSDPRPESHVASYSLDEPVRPRGTANDAGFAPVAAPKPDVA